MKPHTVLKYLIEQDKQLVEMGASLDTNEEQYVRKYYEQKGSIDIQELLLEWIKYLKNSKRIEHKETLYLLKEIVGDSTVDGK